MPYEPPFVLLVTTESIMPADHDLTPLANASSGMSLVPSNMSSPVSEALDMPAQVWEEAPQLSLAELDAIPGRSRLLVQLLHNRGFSDSASVEAFLAGEWRSGGAGLPGLDLAIQRIRAALQGRERIVVFGDFDCDGITSCALLTSVLRALNADVEPYVPRRDDDGRGLNVTAVRDLARRGTRLIITTDCGTSNVEEVELAASFGIDVIVTDHHPLHGPAARAFALVNPRRPDADPRHVDLSGAGVAFRLAEALIAAASADVPRIERAPLPLPESLLDLVAIGTLADIVPLSPENWALARAGLARMNAVPRPGVRALVSRAGLVPGRIVARDVSFGLAPRLNAGGRLDNSMLALQLLLAESDQEVDRLAGELDAMNLRRQELTEVIVADARRQALDTLRAQRSGTTDTGPSTNVVIVQGEDWPLGILGLAAGRLVEELRCPVVVLSLRQDEVRGSARAPTGVDLGAAFASRADLFLRFGGHAQAAGFTIARGNLEALVEHLRLSMVPLAAGAPLGEGPAGQIERFHVDCRLPLRRLKADIYADLDQLQPTGPGFLEPVFLSPRVRLVRCWRSGRDGRNLRLVLRDGQIDRTAVWPRQGDRYERLRAALPFLPALDVLYTVSPFHRPDVPEPEWVIRIASLRPSS